MICKIRVLPTNNADGIFHGVQAKIINIATVNKRLGLLIILRPHYIFLMGIYLGAEGH